MMIVAIYHLFVLRDCQFYTQYIIKVFQLQRNLNLKEITFQF